MTLEETIARLIAVAMQERIASNIVRFGLLARSLPPFHIQTLCDHLSADIDPVQPKFQLALVGFDDTDAPKQRQVATTIEQAVEWRNDRDVTVPIVVLLNPRSAVEKIHSLELLDSFEDVDLRRAICILGERESRARANIRQALFWRVLLTDVARSIPLVAAQLAAYYEAVEHNESFGLALAHLKLFPDPALEAYATERSHQALVKRLNDNYRRIREVGALDKSDNRALAGLLGRNGNMHRSTFLALQSYLRSPSLETLRNLRFDAVVALLEAKDALPAPLPSPPDVQPEPTPTNKNGRKVLSIDEVIIDKMLDQSFDQQPELAALIDDEIAWFYEDPTADLAPEHDDADERPAKVVVDGHELTNPRPSEEKDRHPLEDSMRLWVQVERWGGIVQINEPDEPSEQQAMLPQLFETATALPFAPFQPLNDKRGSETLAQISLIELFESLEAGLDRMSSEDHLADLLRKLSSQRAALAAHRTFFLYRPLHATAKPEILTVIADYVQTYEQLTNRLQRVHLQAAAQYPDAVEQAIAQFLALDMVILDHPNAEAALLTTLHPLHLWKWLELAKRIQTNTQSLSVAERTLLQQKIQRLPTLLNTILLHPHMFSPPRHLDEMRLVLAGEIRNPSVDATMGVPFYQPIARQTITTAGLDQITPLLRYFLALYPPARIGLTMTLIDPPALAPILQACLTLHNEESLLNGACIQVYRTDAQALAYDAWSLDESDALALFRDNPHWTFNIHLDRMDYAAISANIKQHGPQHIILLCDPSEAVALPILRTVQGQPSPFDVPLQLAYDQIRDSVKLVPAPDGGIFDAYINVRNALTGELNRRTLGVGNRHRQSLTKTALETLAAAGYWLIVIDRPHGTLEMPAVGRRLAWQPVESRTVAVWTHDETRWREHLAEYHFDVALVERYLDEALTIFPDGLLAALGRPVADEDEPRQYALQRESVQRLLAVISTLHWYREQNPAAMLLSIDNGQFDDWFQQPPRKHTTTSHLLVVQYQEKTLLIDTIAVQAYDSSFDRLPTLPKAIASLDRLTTFVRTIETLFAPGADATLLAPMRRELLRSSLSTVVFAPSASREFATRDNQRKRIKAEWANVINNLFATFVPEIRLRDVRVALQGSGQPEIQTLDHEPYTTAIVNLPSMANDASVASTPISKVNASMAAADGDKISGEVMAVESLTQVTSQSAVQPIAEDDDSSLVSLQQSQAAPREEIATQAAQLRRVLIEYGIAVARVDEERTQVGPRVIRYWVQLQPPGGRLAEVQKYAVDLARELGSKSVPFIDNIPGERYIGIDLAREHQEMLPFTPALAGLPQQQYNKLLIAMGVDAAGNNIQADLVRLPHMLVAGSTGSGKTMFLSCLIMSLAWRHTATTLELLLIDPKETDFVIFNRLPHLREKRIFYEPAEAITTLQVLTGNERDRRTELLRNASCPNILEYNRRNPQQPLSWIVIVVDEFADIMLTLSRSEREVFERQIGRLAATGRSIGIHLVLATQRPTTDIITGTLKANIPARVSFRLPSGIDSRTILDRTGAENLLGQGDMLALLNGEAQRLQGYYAPYEELEQLLRKIGE